MGRLRRTLCVATLLLAVTVPSIAHANASSGFHIVEQFVAAISAGDIELALSFLDVDGVGLEIAAGPRIVQGALHLRLWLEELVRGGTRLDTELLAVYGDERGHVFVTLDRMWADTIPADLAPLHATGTYLVQRGQIASITRLVAPAERDAWLTRLLVGSWRCGWYLWRLAADGRFTLASSNVTVDGGQYEVVEGTLRLVSDGSSVICADGATGSFALSFSGPDRFLGRKISDACGERAPGGQLPVFRSED